ncbi:MAG TPA: hypothetical protein VNG33_03250 [Polyangiaceae bacterium]|nr:hypothetical protein [Polyangiaceae bacterium]
MKRAALTTLALGAFVVENSFDFVGSVPYFRRITGGLGILDLLPLPDPERAHRALALLGEAGRHQYGVLLVSFDILFPLTLALFFHSWLSGRLLWLPWLTLALDYAENVACGALLATFPHESAAVASLAGVLTALKMAGYAACLVALLFSVGSTIRRQRRDSTKVRPSA